MNRLSSSAQGKTWKQSSRYDEHIRADCGLRFPPTTKGNQALGQDMWERVAARSMEASRGLRAPSGQLCDHLSTHRVLKNETARASNHITYTQSPGFLTEA